MLSGYVWVQVVLIQSCPQSSSPTWLDSVGVATPCLQVGFALKILEQRLMNLVSYSLIDFSFYVYSPGYVFSRIKQGVS